MELKYVLMTLLKILVSTPSTLFVLTIPQIYGTALVSHTAINPNGTINNRSEPYYDYEFAESEELENRENNGKSDSEEIPDPSPLVLPGYNLPENIFNQGKPFYVEKDPLTGQIDFNHKSPSLRLDEEYDYVDEEHNDDIYDKANINRKDGNVGSHRPSDVNQLTPNFHDFLNLPVKYNPDKYVYPLISNSYATTKIQGSVNKFHNHKDYALKTNLYKPTVSPTYYSTYSPYFSKALTTTTSTTTTARSTAKPTTVKKYPEIYLTTETNHAATSRQPDKFYSSTTSHPSTKKIISFFEQFFGDYDDPETTTQAVKGTPPPSLFSNLPSNKYKNKYQMEIKTEKSSYITSSTSSTTSTTTTTTVAPPPVSYDTANVLSGSNMGLESDYDYDYEPKYEDAVAVETKIDEQTSDDDLSIEPLHVTSLPVTTTTFIKIKPSMLETDDKKIEMITESKYNTSERELLKINNGTTTSTPQPITTPTIQVTSLPVSESHITSSNPISRDPIIVATQNLREKLNSEKVIPKPFKKPAITNNIHVAHDQNTVSLVVGNQQTINENNEMKHPYTQSDSYTNDNSLSYTIQSQPETNFQLAPSMPNYPEIEESGVTNKPVKNFEPTLAIEVPIDSFKQTPVQNAQADSDSHGMGTKIVFPNEKDELSDLVPPPPRLPAKDSSSNNNILSFNSKPLYHQLPSDLTPPKESKPGPSRPIRPPWDPRPGHFHSGKPEYSRPPRPDIVYKRIDNLPNILPQFRPNMKKHNIPFFQDSRLVRQPLLERPSNRPIGYYEKLQPPPPSFSLRQNLQLRNSLEESEAVEERRRPTPPDDQFELYQTPPQIKIANRRSDDNEVETLQMIQAKNIEKPDEKENLSKVTQTVVNTPVENNKDNTEKSIYKVYPVNSSSIKSDMVEFNNKEKVNKDFLYDQNPLFDQKDRNDSPILKPHPRPSTFPIKSDFPYPLERPDPSLNHPAVPETPSKNGNDLDELPAQKYEDNIFSNNQWITEDDLESRIVTGQKVHAPTPNQISATLQTFTEKPIAIAYTPTTPNLNAEQYQLKYDSPNKEFTVGVMMHTQKQAIVGNVDDLQKDSEDLSNHKTELDRPNYPKLDFEAPFQASVNLDNSVRNGWSVVRDKNKTTTDSEEATTLPYATTSEFNIENFKPQLEGGFKPIYSFPDEKNISELKVNDREE